MQEEKNCAVLFLHGFLGNPDFFNQFIPQIPKSYDIYNVRLCGHGGGVKDFANSSMEMWKTQVNLTVQALAGQYKKIAIVAHSMGTFFAMEAAVAFPDKVKLLFLLGTPLKIFVRPAAVGTAARLFFNFFPKHDETLLSFKSALGVRLNKRVWEYLGWIPRYMELFRESNRARKTIRNVNVPCHIFQSEHDEVVSMKTMEYIPQKESIFTTVLKESSHFIYSDKDFKEVVSYLNNHLTEIL